MRLRACWWLAFSSVCLIPLAGETRPHYGGTLNVEAPTFPVPVFETLVRVNLRGRIEPVLAVAWQHDPDFKRWRFSLRSKVLFHDGEPFTAASAVPSLLQALQKEYPEVAIEAGGQALLIKCGQPMPDLLELLAWAAISRSDIGTGPFRIAKREPQRTAFNAFEDYWGGRPYLDRVVIEGASERGSADIFDLPPGPSRRIVPEGWTIWGSAPKTLVALQGLHVDANVLKALALGIDRKAIANVLAQHKAEAAFGLLPQWLSGYEFLFQSAPDIARAKQIVAQMHPAPLSLEASGDPFLRSVAERIALNARDVGIAIQLKASGDLRLLELPIESTNAMLAIELMKLGDRAPSDLTKPEAAYELERAQMEQAHIIPLVHLRETYATSPKVHFQPSRDQFALHLEDAWIQP